MQKIFSQEIRFKDDNGNSYPEWESAPLFDIFLLLKEKAYRKIKFLMMGNTNVFYMEKYILHMQKN